MNTVFETENIKFIELTELLVQDYLEMINDINVARLLGSAVENSSVISSLWMFMMRKLSLVLQ